MTTLNISLPDDLQAFIDEQIAKGEYSTASEYISHLICQARKQAEQKRLETLLLEGLESGEAIEVNDDWWEEKRDRLIEKLRKQ
ncbi:MAG: type II toxin-antitoxin system ParD family antitoxin [Waterburya sp.]